MVVLSLMPGILVLIRGTLYAMVVTKVIITLLIVVLSWMVLTRLFVRAIMTDVIHVQKLQMVRQYAL